MGGNDIALDGYNVFRTDRCRPPRGGGVAIFIKKGFSVTVVDSVAIPKCFEYLALSVSLNNSANGGKITVLGVYRPPSAPSTAISDLAHLISSYLSSEVILMGDLNLDWLSNASDGL